MENKKVCRTCLDEIVDTSHSLCTEFTETDSSSITIVHKLLHLLPQIDVIITVNAAICTTCASSIDSAYKFKQKCLKTEEIIEDFGKRGGSSNVVDLVELVQRRNDADIKLECFKEEAEDIKEELDSTLYDAFQRECLDSQHEHQLVDTDLVEFNTDSKLEQNVEGKNISETFYECYECEYRASRKLELVSHIKIHGKKNEVPDAINVDSTPHHFTLKTHKKFHAGIKSRQCTECDFRCIDKSRLKQHMSVHLIGKLYNCDKCDFSTAYRSKLIIHIRTHTGERPFKCRLCDYSSTRSDTLKYHMLVHKDEKPFKCSMCSFSTRAKSTLKCHIKLHAGDPQYKCSVCDYRTVSNTILKAHMKSHSEDKSYKCPQCEYSSNLRGNLANHMLTHIEENRFKCAQCNYSGKLKHNLKQHIVAMHSDIRPYKCTVCNYQAINNCRIKTHMRTHIP